MLVARASTAGFQLVRRFASCVTFCCTDCKLCTYACICWLYVVVCVALAASILDLTAPALKLSVSPGVGVGVRARAGGCPVAGMTNEGRVFSDFAVSLVIAVA